MKKKNNSDIPIGLGMALAQDIDAMKYFSSMSTEQQKEIINQAKNIRSKQEMHQFVEQLSSNQTNTWS